MKFDVMNDPVSLIFQNNRESLYHFNLRDIHLGRFTQSNLFKMPLFMDTKSMKFDVMNDPVSLIFQNNRESSALQSPRSHVGTCV
jgi:hypothetical protein